MAETRIVDEGFQKHLTELIESAGSLNEIAAQLASAVDQVSNAWHGEGATTWKAFAIRSNASQEQMKTALTSIMQKLEGVAKASTAGQAHQRDAVATRSSTANADEPIFT